MRESARCGRVRRTVIARGPPRGTARLVMLPNESHAYRARESIMTMLAESERWLEQTIGPAEQGTAKKKR